MLHRKPFEPFRILMSGGESSVIRNPDPVALMKTRVFNAAPGADRSTLLRYLHVVGVETLANGQARRPGRTRRR